MKNFQQTPKQRRVVMTANKQKLAASKPLYQRVPNTWTNRAWTNTVALLRTKEQIDFWD